MAKETYNVDDILSEVKRHREQEKARQEQELRRSSAAPAGEVKPRVAAQPKPQNAPQAAKPVHQEVRRAQETSSVSEIKKSAPKPAEQKPAEKTNQQKPVSKPQENKPAVKAQQQKPAERQQERKSAEKIQQAKAEKKAQPPVKEAEEKKAAAASQAVPKAEKRAVSAPAPKEEAPMSVTEKIEVPPLEPVNFNRQPSKEERDEMIDLFSASGNEALEPDKKGKKKKKDKKNKDGKTLWRSTKQGKIVLSIISVLLVLIIGLSVFAVCYFNGLLGKFTDDTDDYKKTETSYNGMDFLKENFPAIEEMSASEATTYKEYLKSWYKNGDPVSSTHVKNIMLIGEDTREEEITDTSRADSAIIASVNIDTGKITLTSVLRDLYVYYEVDGEGQYGKINEAASLGGMEEYIRTVERYYKVQIDNYAVVNFASFPKIIDSLGGVEVEIEDREINEINSHPNRYGNVYIEKTYDGTEGVMTLDGEQALAFCRIRKIDSDNARSDRQKTVLLALFNKMKGASKTELLKVVNDLVGYVYTGYSKKELVSLATYALSNGWLNYETQTINVPTTENANGGNYLIGQSYVTPCSSSQGIWLWKSDIPEDAYQLQMLIYGKSNITLAENRCNYCELL